MPLAGCLTPVVSFVLDVQFLLSLNVEFESLCVMLRAVS